MMLEVSYDEKSKSYSPFIQTEIFSVFFKFGNSNFTNLPSTDSMNKAFYQSLTSCI